MFVFNISNQCSVCDINVTKYNSVHGYRFNTKLKIIYRDCRLFSQIGTITLCINHSLDISFYKFKQLGRVICVFKLCVSYCVVNVVAVLTCVSPKNLTFVLCVTTKFVWRLSFRRDYQGGNQWGTNHQILISHMCSILLLTCNPVFCPKSHFDEDCSGIISIISMRIFEYTHTLMAGLKFA